MARVKIIPAEGYGVHIRSVVEISDRLVDIELEVLGLSLLIENLIESLLEQGIETSIILESVKQATEKNEEQLRLLNARTEEAFNTKINEEDIT